MNLKCSRK